VTGQFFQYPFNSAACRDKKSKSKSKSKSGSGSKSRSKKGLPKKTIAISISISMPPDVAESVRNILPVNGYHRTETVSADAS